jgi:drug/metabolite transporter (DMT)-like permease
MIGPISTVSLGALLLDEPFKGWIIAVTILVVRGDHGVTRAAHI